MNREREYVFRQSKEDYIVCLISRNIAVLSEKTKQESRCHYFKTQFRRQLSSFYPI